MGIKRVVDVDFWQDNTTLYEMTVEDRYFHLYLMTNPKSKQVGIYRLPVKYMGVEVGYSEEVVRSLLKRAEDDFKSILYDHKTQEVTILNSLSSTILKGGDPVADLLIKELSEVESTHLIEATYEKMFDFWKLSKRPFDKTIESLFKNELDQRAKSLEQLAETKENPELNEPKANDEDVSTEQIATTLDDPESNDHSGDYEAIIQSCQDKRFYVGGADREMIQKWCQNFNTDLMIEALERSTSAKRPIRYANTILNNWQQDNVTTVAEVMSHDEAFKSQFSRDLDNDKEEDDPYANIKIPIDYWKHE